VGLKQYHEGWHVHRPGTQEKFGDVHMPVDHRKHERRDAPFVGLVYGRRGVEFLKLRSCV
jgi:hypothetical protein